MLCIQLFKGNVTQGLIKPEENMLPLELQIESHNINFSCKMEAVSHKVELMCHEEKLFFQSQSGLLVILQLT